MIIFCLVLKHTLRQARPLARSSLLHEYGMPSSHSQFMWFFTTYMFLFLWVRLRHISNTTIWVWIWKTAITAACLMAAIIVSVSRFKFLLFIKKEKRIFYFFVFRIYLQYHTVFQVIVGALLGSVLGVLWFFFTQFVLTPRFPAIASWSVCLKM